MIRSSGPGPSLLLCGALCTLLAAGCDTPSARPPSPPLANVCAQTGPVRELTYHRDVKPLLEAKCNGCHTPGGAAPFALTDAQQVVALQAPLLQAVCERSMPPWSPHPACNQYAHDRSLSDEQIALLRDWVRAGAPLGEPTDAPAPTPASPGRSRVDLELPMPQPYVPQQQPDEYRCVLIDWPRADEVFVTGVGIRPGQKRLVHHVIVGVVPPESVADYTRADEADPALGFSCFGGPTVRNAEGALVDFAFLGGWVPGSSGTEVYPGTGIRVRPGSKLVMQMHYNTSSAPPAADSSTVLLKLESSVQREAFILPFTNPNWVRKRELDIPAGQADVFHVFSYDALEAASRRTSGRLNEDRPLEVQAVNVHMHKRGTRASLTVERSGQEAACLLELPRWDFHWQGTYQLRQPVRVLPGDSLRLECHWNNAGLTTHHGETLPPVPGLNWGEGTDDEMCLALLYVHPG